MALGHMPVPARLAGEVPAEQVLGDRLPQPHGVRNTGAVSL